MKRILQIAVLALAVIGLNSCNKGDEYPFVCDGFQQDPPLNDSAMVKMPTAFTPNGDGLNDMFAPTVQGIVSITFTVYNERENVVFYTEQLNKAWQAPQPAQKDTYHYRVEAVTNKGNRIARCGTIYALNCIPPGTRQSDFIFSDQLDPGFPEGYINTAERLSACK